MSSNPAASAALAASVAFKGTYQVPNQKRKTKPPLYLAINTDVDGSKTSLVAAQTSQLRSQKMAAPTANKPAHSPIGQLGLVREKHKQTSGTSDDDVSSSVLLGTDYFSTSRVGGSSGNSEGGVASPHRLRTNVNLKPHEMLEQVRKSINSKSKVGFGKDLHRKSQLAIDQVRQNVDQHRIRTIRDEPTVAPDTLIDTAAVAPVVPPVSKSTAEIAAADSDRVSVSNGQRLLYNQALMGNHSHSSIGTGTSNDFEGPDTPIIKLSRTVSIGLKVLSSSVSPSPVIAPSTGPYGHIAPSPLAPSPIAIPPSPNALARGLAISDAQILVLLLLPSVTGSVAELPEEPRKAHRKPPPADFPSEDDVSLSGHSLSMPASDIDEEHKLPIFPDIEGKHKKHKFFHRKHKKDTVFESNALEEDEVADKDEEFIPSRSATPVVNTQQVKFKTTMRKVNKRRERKTAFNEDKPWKNHGELDYVSETQRKRYEGLWVSNRGLYMNKVVTPLVGVKYEKDEALQEEEPKDKKLSEKEISQKAAKLSSTANTEFQEHDIQQLHGLCEAEPLELMHGVVVKRLWSRSKLSSEELASIWDLVDFRKDGTLNKAEFIVGMWLVDQCLYGRKLPKEIPELVWTSLGSIGVRVVIKKKRR